MKQLIPSKWIWEKQDLAILNKYHKRYGKCYANKDDYAFTLQKSQQHAAGWI